MIAVRWMPVFLPVVLWTPAHAQDTTATLPEIVITATRAPTPREHVAARVTVLSGADLRRRGLTAVAEALREVPGVAVVRVGAPGGLTSVFLRGGESDHVRVLVDGVPLNEPGGAVDLADLTLDNVERIEVVRGPVSVLYGSDAVAGVIQVFTRGGAGPARAEAGARVGSYGTLEVDAALAAGDDRASLSLAGSRRTSDGLYPFNNRYRNATVSGRLRAAPDAHTVADLTFRYGDHEYHFPTDGAGNAVDRNAFQLGSATTLGLALTRQVSERVQTRLLLAHHAVSDGLDDRPDDAADTLGGFAARAQRDLHRQGADLSARAALGAGVAVTVGAAVELERERSERTDESSFGTFRSGTDTTVARFNHAYYGQVLGTHGAFTVNAGARLDANETFGTFVTVRGGVAYRLRVGTRLFASAGTAFKEPTFFENYGGAFVTGNADLAPERSVSVEAGVEQQLLADRLVVAVTGFRQRFRDLIDFTFAPPAPDAPNYFNVAGASADGVELELTARPVTDVLVRAAFTRLRATVTDSGFDGGAGSAFGAGQRLLRRPRATATLEAQWALRPRATVGAVVRHVGSRDDLDFASFPATRVVLDAYTLVDVSAELRVLSAGAGGGGLTVTGRIENLFDASWRQAFGFLTPGRTVLVGGRVRY